MEILTYKCDKGHIFDGTEHTDKCADCGSNNITLISNQNNKKSNFNKRNLIRGLFLFFILIIISTMIFIKFHKKSILSISGDYYTVSFQNQPGCLVVKVTKANNIDTTNYFNQFKNYFQFKDPKGNLIQPANDNIIYPCDSGKISITWKKSPDFPLIDTTITSKQIEVKFKNGKHHPNAICELALKIETVKANNTCQLVVTTNLDNVKSKNILISINGRNGTFKNQRVWPAKNINKIDVWAKKEGDTTIVEFIRNGDKFQAVGCIECTPQSKNEMLKKFISAANKYGNDPDNNKLFIEFSKLINDPEIILNGKKLSGGISELDNSINPEHYNGSIFYINESSIKIDNNCVITSFEFKKK